MSIAERKAKEKEELKDLILQAAKELFVEKGVEKTTIRNIADKISYSIGTVYVYFRDKNEILHALHSLGFRQYAERQLALQHIPDPMDRLIARGRSYILFALENPDMYDLMFNLKAPLDYLNVMQSEWIEGKTVIKRLRTTVEECIQQGYFPGMERDAVSSTWFGPLCMAYVPFISMVALMPWILLTLITCYSDLSRILQNSSRLKISLPLEHSSLM